MKLLCVDDDWDVLIARAAVLRLAGFRVITCSGPVEGLATLESKQVDAIVTDYDMPVMDGLAFAERARSKGFAQPIILCTGWTDLPVDRLHLVDRVVAKADRPWRLVEVLRSSLQVGPGSKCFDGCTPS